LLYQTKNTAQVYTIYKINQINYNFGTVKMVSCGREKGQNFCFGNCKKGFPLRPQGTQNNP